MEPSLHSVLHEFAGLHLYIYLYLYCLPFEYTLWPLSVLVIILSPWHMGVSACNPLVLLSFM